MKYILESRLEKWFKGHKVDPIELPVKGTVKDWNVTMLFVSYEVKSGCKLH